MGSILAPMRFIKNTIPEIVQHMKEDRVDVVLLIPF
jgi:protoheme ferro-lyase